MTVGKTCYPMPMFLMFLKPDGIALDSFIVPWISAWDICLYEFYQGNEKVRIVKSYL